MPPPPTPAHRAPLSRDRILAAALGLADDQGLDALTMRRLGQELGVEAMSLYHHVSSKEDLLDALADHLLAQVTVPPPGTPWRTALDARAVSLRALLRPRPWAFRVIEGRGPSSPVRMGYPDAVLGLLRGDGFSAPNAIRAFVLIDAYVYGFLLQESTWEFDMDDLGTEVAAMQDAMPTGQYPWLREAMETVVAPGARLGIDDQFRFGLDLLLDGLERIRT